MAELTQEQYEQLPEFVSGDYEKHGDIYRPKAEGKAEALKGSLNALDEKFKSTEQTLKDMQVSQQEAIERAKAEALAEAMKSGDAEAVEKRYQEMMADMKTRHETEIQKVNSSFDTLAGTVKASTKEALLASIRGELQVFDDSAKVFDSVVGGRIDIDPLTGNATFLNDDGSASSLDKAGFVDVLSKDQSFSRMRKGIPSGQGGHANGNNSAGGAHRKLSEMTLTERAKLANERPEEYQQLSGT